jgi:hypothetical protein
MLQQRGNAGQRGKEQGDLPRRSSLHRQRNQQQQADIACIPPLAWEAPLATVPPFLTSCQSKRASAAAAE